MEETIKFRAVITPKRTVIYFTLREMIVNIFSNRELLNPWLMAGNNPDRFTGFVDRAGVEIYQNDIVRDGNTLAIVTFTPYCMYLSGGNDLTKDMKYNFNYSGGVNINTGRMEFLTVVGNCHENPELDFASSE